MKVLRIRTEFMNKITIATYRMVPMANDVKKVLTNVALYLATTRIPVLESQRLAKRRASAASDILV